MIQGRYFFHQPRNSYQTGKLLQLKKRSSLLRILPDRSGGLPDELLRRNLKLNAEFVALASLDPVDQRRDDHVLRLDAIITPFWSAAESSTSNCLESQGFLCICRICRALCRITEYYGFRAMLPDPPGSDVRS